MKLITLSNGETIVANKVVKIGVIQDNKSATNYTATSWYFKIYSLGDVASYYSGNSQREVEYARDLVIKALESVEG